MVVIASSTHKNEISLHEEDQHFIERRLHAGSIGSQVEYFLGLLVKGFDGVEMYFGNGYSCPYGYIFDIICFEIALNDFSIGFCLSEKKQFSMSHIHLQLGCYF